MRNRFHRHASPHAVVASLFTIALVVASHAPASRAAAQHDKREHLTPQEIESVRDAQALDARTTVFIKAAERRMQAIFGQIPADVKQSKKDKDKDAKITEDWGDLPTATRAELLYDIAHILDEAIENVDDTAQRDPKSALIPKAVRKLSDAAQRFLSQLTPLRASTIDKAEREQLEQAIDNAQQIIEAAKKVPAEETKEKPGKKG
jgi:hypothetical protein